MRICIVTDVSLLFNPRVVKEADALAEAGHDVRVVTVHKSAANLDGEAKLLSTRKWSYEEIDCAPDGKGGYYRWLRSGVRSKAFNQLSKLAPEGRLLELAFCRYRQELLGLVMKESADLYIGHNLQNLPVAASAARANKALLGFDIEDYHLDEDTPGKSEPRLRRAKEFLMRKYIPLCTHLSATSNCMANVVSETFHVKRPTVLYNSFPLSYRDGIDDPPLSAGGGDDPNSSYTAYWFSQVIGLDRGLQDFIRALPKLSRRVNLHLRGRLTGQVEDDLVSLATSVGARDQIFFYDVIHAEDIVKDAARFDFGLALEQPMNQNKKVTISNKLFVYMLAGIVPVTTNTPGQREVVGQFEDSVVLYKPGDIEALIHGMNGFLDCPERMVEAKQQVWQLAASTFCWDVEKQKLLDAIHKLEEQETSRVRGAVA